ncbi:28470_t:CDS:1, partial [Racocetra persica]
MVDASKWLDEKIPEDQRAQATCLHIYVTCQSGHNSYNYNCGHCQNPPASKCPIYKFIYAILDGELNLNSF